MDISNRNWSNKRILIAEDTNSNFQLLEAALKYTNVSIEWVQTGTEVVEKALSNEYDLILMDVQMPGMDGVEATTVIKNSKPNLPIIIQTAYALKIEREKILNSGCNAFLTKPLSIDQLYQSIAEFLD